MRLVPVRRWVIALCLLLVSVVSARATSGYIGRAFPDRPAPADLAFRLLPHVQWVQYLTDVAVLTGAVLVLVHIARRDPAELPAAVTLFALMELARAFMTVLTPLAGPLGNGAHYGFVHVTQNGQIPSGHVGAAVLFYLLVDGRSSPRLRAVMLALAVAEAVALLLSRGHYSIDIVAGALLSYALYQSWAFGRGLNAIKRLVSAGP